MRSKQVIKHVLSNGLTILIKPTHRIPKVSVQLWYDVGSKDEQTGERGKAHFIEHMIFKGTEILAEGDIDRITSKLSGYANAFTSFDYTGYLFDLPSQHWSQILPIMADCMTNCLFNEAHLTSELKAVIQELKMFNDNYVSSLLKLMVTSIFEDHPYHHPVIGYKQDLWSLKSDDLKRFYKHHYIPNNATLVVVGDVDPDETIKEIETSFGAIAPDPSYTKGVFYHSPDLKSQSVTIYRDVALSSIVLGWVVPGLTRGDGYLLDIVAWIVGLGKGSRFHRKFVDELQIVTSLEVILYDLFDHGLFLIYFQPTRPEDIDTIISLIQAELCIMEQEPVTHEEVERAVNQSRVSHLEILEDNQEQAYEIGKLYLATRDEECLYKPIGRPIETLVPQVQDFVKSYLRSSLMHKGMVLPLKPEDKPYWINLQDISDQEDNAILSKKVREKGALKKSAIDMVTVAPPKHFMFPRAQTALLENGLKLLFHSYSELPKIDIILDMRAKHTSDPRGKEGIAAFVGAMLLEGTKNYTASAFFSTLESYGMALSSGAGRITLSCLSSDLPKALEFLQEMLMSATFPLEAIEKVRAQLLADIHAFWDSPLKVSEQLAREEVYKGLSQSKFYLGTQESIRSITRNDLLAYYQSFISPQGARIAVVGDLENYDVKAIFDEMLGVWEGPEVARLIIEPIVPLSYHEKGYPLLRDQTALCYAGVSVARTDKDYDALLLFDQIFSGGMLKSMSSRLFALREQTGLFYTIGGSLISGCDEQKGLMTVKTVVSNDRLKEAELAIAQVILHAHDIVSDDEFNSAKRTVINSLVDNFSTNYQTAATFLFLDTYEFPPDYYDARPFVLDKITKEDMQKVVAPYMNIEQFILAKAGRI